MAHLVLVLTLVVWSLSFLAAAWVRRDLSVTEALAARFLPVLPVTLLALLWRRPRFPAGAWPRIVALGLLAVPVYNVFFFAGMKTVPSGTASLIVALNPAITALLAWAVLKEPFGPRKALGLALAFAGLFVVVRFGTDRPVDWPYLSSALLLALAPASWAVYTVIGKTMPAGTDPFDASFALLAVGALPLVVFATPHLGRTLLTSPLALGSSLYLGFLCTLFGFTAWLWALKRLPAGEVAAFVFLNPPLANLWAWLVEDAPLRAPFAAGALVLLAGVALIVVPAWTPVPTAPPEP